MGDYHFVYKDVEGTSTQWDDIQRKLGNLPPKAPVFKPDPFTPGEDDSSKSKDKDWIDEKNQDELDDLEDDPDLNDDRFLQEYRMKRMAEMREVAKIVRFGSVIPISGSDFVREVSQAPEDIWVVVLLYKDGYSGCQILLQSLEELATKYTVTKFVKIISTDCIPNYPDCNLPTVLVYHNGALKSNYVGLHSFGRRCTPEGGHGFKPWKQPLAEIQGVALTLCQSDPVLNDGRSKQGQSREAVLDGVRKSFLDKVVAQHEDDDGSSSD
ncbi:hypothetical protein RND71_036224 [Anisodus tanguticus]|uniref:Phosducin domain-containing protein n=1 Tax=Anisodus tanguticus TaxID=243964 RepID=A0AAE1R6P1_9SOLA|nr:hypothetical protein RND71_036224 [Anisodus tanguticus]